MCNIEVQHDIHVKAQNYKIIYIYLYTEMKGPSQMKQQVHVVQSQIAQTQNLYMCKNAHHNY